MKRTYLLPFALFLLFVSSFLSAQTGITVGPPRTYFTTQAGESQTHKLIVSNPSKSGSMNLVVSLNDWSYDKNGSNVVADSGTLPTSLSGWLVVMPQTFFTLAPGESKELEVTLTAPSSYDPNVPVRTALLYITQTNPADSFNEKGALIKVSVRTGVKIYHRFAVEARNPDLQFTGFKYEKDSKSLKLSFDNTGNVWTDGMITSELISQADGSTIKLEDQAIYTMPGDQRELVLPLPKDLKPGKYIATSTFSHSEKDVIKMAELTFTHE